MILALSCNDNNGDETIKQATGDVWLSGGLYHCAEQIHLEKGETLIVGIEDIIDFRSGDKVKVYYKEIGINEFCSPHIDCEIIGLIKID
jgi:hypothetical protein